MGGAPSCPGPFAKPPATNLRDVSLSYADAALDRLGHLAAERREMPDRKTGPVSRGVNQAGAGGMGCVSCGGDGSDGARSRPRG
jgi:hypothetical protein